MPSQHELVRVWNKMNGATDIERIRFHGVANGEVSNFAHACEAECISRQRVPSLIGLQLDNNWRCVVAMLVALKAGASVCLIGSETEAHSVTDLAAQRGCDAVFANIAESASLTVTGCASSFTADEPSIEILTSGSTGEPKPVLRPLSSWLAEAGRYTDRLTLGQSEHVLFIAPIMHSYALGFFWGAFLGGATIELSLPTALRYATDALQERATVAVVTPTLANLLAKRYSGPAQTKQLKYAMAGAGPVTDAIDASFLKAFGLRLSRNFGSTESGAVACGLAPLPPLCVGQLFPSLKSEIKPQDDDHSLPLNGTLTVQTEDGVNHHFGDQVQLDDSGRISILGRKQQGIRRGEKWLSPLEIENALMAMDAVKDAHVSKVTDPTNGDDRVIARVVPEHELSVEFETQTREHCREHLPPEMQPDLIEPALRIRRMDTGKPEKPKRYRLADSAHLAEIARAYKTSSLLFAFLDCGLLESLAQGTDAGTLAYMNNLRPEAVEAALAVAELAGLVTTDSSKRGQSRATGFDEMLSLECQLMKTLASPSAIGEVLMSGLHNRPYDAPEVLPSEDFRKSYAGAMDGPHREFHRLLALRKISVRDNAKILEIGASGGRYIATLLNKFGDNSSGWFQQVGRLCPPLSESAVAFQKSGRLLISESGAGFKDKPNGQFDVIILDNCVHGPRPGGDLEAVAAQLSDDGVLLIDDIFLPQGQDAGIGVDWITHGGVENLTVDDCKRRLHALGLRVTQLGGPGEASLRTILLATWKVKND